MEILLYGKYEEILYKHLVPKIYKQELSHILLTAWSDLDKRKKEEYSYYRTGKRPICELFITLEFSASGANKCLAAHISNEIISKIPRKEDLIDDFKQLIAGDKTIRKSTSERLGKMAQVETLSEYLAEILIFTVERNNDLIEKIKNQEKLAATKRRMGPFETYIHTNSKPIPKTHSLFHYDSGLTDFYGRDKELSELLSFCDSPDEDKPIKWWAITGKGGIGKSRLALRLCDLLDDTVWDTYWPTYDFFRSDASPFSTFTNWYYPKKLLLIVDNVSTVSSNFVVFLTKLCKTITVKNSIRILVIERSGFLTESLTRKTGSFVFEHEGFPVWYTEMLLSDEKNILDYCCYDKYKKSIQLTSLSNDSLVEICKNAALSQNNDTSITQNEANEIVEFLKTLTQNLNVLSIFYL